MSRRMGTLLYRLGALIAVLAIVSAVAWNAWTINQRQQVRTTFDSQFKEELPPVFTEEELRNRHTGDDVATVLAQRLKQSRASTEALRQSITFGGILIIIGLIAFALGWAARSSRRRE